jgi:hypothetical protein
MNKIYYVFFLLTFLFQEKLVTELGELQNNLPVQYQIALDLGLDFLDCEKVQGESCAYRIKKLSKGAPLFLNEQMVLHYVQGEGKVITDLPKSVHNEIREVCSSPQAKEGREEGKIQVSSYGVYPTEVSTSLGSFGCLEYTNHYLVIDTWQVDRYSKRVKDDLIEGGQDFKVLLNKACELSSCKPFEIRALIPKEGT